jgi:5-methylcytosine-specific restriction protein A
MPLRPSRPCSTPGCGALVRRGRCPTHSRAANVRRGSASSRGYGVRWRRYRRAFLAAHPLCADCDSNNRTTLAVVVDHIIAHRGWDALFWDPENHQALCVPCHNAKSVRELRELGPVVR